MVEDTATGDNSTQAPPLPADAAESLDELRALLWRHHKVTVDEDDPVLLVHTILRVWLDDLHAVLGHEAGRFRETVDGGADALLAQARAAISELKSDGLKDAIRERVAMSEDLQKATASAHAALRRSLRLMAVLTVMNYAAVAITGTFVVYVIGF